MADASLRVGGYAGLLLAVPAVVAWASGRPFVFPSLGPTAFVLARARYGDGFDPANRAVFGGHVVGVVAGLAAYHAVAPSAAVTAELAPFSPVALRLVAAAVLALVLTSVGMLVTDTVHPPACATTLIVSLGLLPTPADGAVIAVAVALLLGVDRSWRRLVTPTSDARDAVETG